MAAVLHLPTGTAPSREDAEAAIAVALAYLQDQPARLAVPISSAFRNRFEALEAAKLASTVTPGGDTKAAEKIAGRGNRTSKRTRRNAAKRAAAVNKNAALADKMANGDLSGEQVDLLADAASKAGDAALHDPDLIDKVAAVDPDQGKAVVADYVAKNTDAGRAQSRHDRQRAGRRVRRFMTEDKLDALVLAGDRETIDRIETALNRRSNLFYRQDGGRDIPVADHPRTSDQRKFDAITDLILNDSTTPGDDTAPASETPADSPDDTTATPRRDGSQRRTARDARPTVVVSVTLEKFLGLSPEQAATLLGSGPIADTILAQYVEAASTGDADIIGAIFDQQGHPLWLGRSVRYANRAQHTALIVRDKGCVLCAAHHTRCEAHHRLPWSAPAQGPTNIDNLALLCQSCHHRIHNDKQTLYQDDTTRTWKLRPALPHEIAPPRPPKPARAQAPLRT